MNDWVAGYRAALADVGRLAHARGVLKTGDDQSGRHALMLAALLADLAGDALVIEREQDNRIRRHRLAAVREALPLFEQKAAE